MLAVTMLSSVKQNHCLQLETQVQRASSWVLGTQARESARLQVSLHVWNGNAVMC